MKKCIALLLVTALLLVLLPGCHGAVQRQEFAIPESFDMSRNYEITFWAKNENNENQQAIYAQAVAAFQEIYPNIHVNL